MLFSSWSDLARLLAFGIISYAFLILVLRISGKRTLSKMNAFDLVITVAMGSTLATILLSKDVALVEGVAALALLVFLQFAITWTSMRSARVRDWIKSEPTLLLHRGRFLRDAMRRERVTEEEILAAVRAQGHGTIEAVGEVVLETDGTLSVTSGEGSDTQPMDSETMTG